MKQQWTIAEAKAHVEKVKDKKHPQGLKYCSAVDFLRRTKKRKKEASHDSDEHIGQSHG